jgi:hypothetical protein
LFRLIKLGVALVGFVAFAWFGATVKLGSQTLFEHLHAIGQTKESQELVEGTRQAAGPLVDDVRRRFHEGTGPGSTPDAGVGPSVAPSAPSEERLSSADRQALHHLIRRVDR